MLNTLTPFLLFGTALLLGLRHGIDWDHIAAITDITTSTDKRGQSFFLGTLYVLGHSMVIIILGLAAVIVGVRLPGWVDSVTEPFVGVTLIFLGIYLLFSIIRNGKNVKMKSRWMLIFAAATKIYNFIELKVTHKHRYSHFHYPENFGSKTAFSVGIIHGIGAETPSQLLLFVAATGAGGSIFGILLVFTFVTGLILSNSIIIVLSVLGISKARSNTNIYLFLAGVTAIFSLTVGILLLLGKTSFLPAIIGG